MSLIKRCTGVCSVCNRDECLNDIAAREEEERKKREEEEKKREEERKVL